MSADRRTGLARPPVEPGWSYDGGSLTDRLADVRQVRLLREHVSGGVGDGTFSWMADRGLVLTSATDVESLLLALPADSENAALISCRPLPRPLRSRRAPRAGCLAHRAPRLRRPRRPPSTSRSTWRLCPT